MQYFTMMKKATVLLLLASVSSLSGAELRLLSAEVMKPALRELIAEFEKTTGHRITVTYDSAGKVRSRFLAGEPADAIIVQLPVAEDLASTGKVFAGSVQVLSRSGLGLGVRRGLPHPDLSSAATVKQTLLAASSLAYPDPTRGAASGILFLSIIRKMGITAELESKTRFTQGSLVDFAQQQQTDIAVTQPAEILAAPSYEFAGWLPDELQDYKNFTWATAVAAGAAQPQPAEAFVQFLASPPAIQVFIAKGMKAATK